MTEINLLAGVTSSEQADINSSLPINLEFVPTQSGISGGYFRSPAGVRVFNAYFGRDKGGIVWQGRHYRVIGGDLITVAQDGSTNFVGGFTGDSVRARLDYSFDRLMINYGMSLYLYNGTTLTQVTDPDLGQCVDALWMDGYFVSTDGTSIVVTQLSNPLLVDPLKYGSAEEDPDNIVGLLKLQRQLVALGGRTIQFFTNAGGSGFPFAPNINATLSVGCVGRDAKSLYSNGFAWIGQRRNQQPGVWYSEGGDPQKLSTRAVDDIIAADPAQANIVVEERTDRNEQRLYVHLSDRTLVYLRTASEGAQARVWYIASAGRTSEKRYRPRRPVLAYGKWIVGDADGRGLGMMDESTATVFGEATGWRLDTPFAFSEARGGILHRLELTGMLGRGGSASMFLSQTVDGETWGDERVATPVPSGGRRARVVWRPHRKFANFIGLRLRGDSDALASIARLDVEVEPLTV